jgi:two-component system, chemotaxis family, sensor kinase CheA
MKCVSDPARIFREEAGDLLTQLEEALLGLEDAPDDRELIDSAFRALHTLKGSGAMFGFEAMARFSHHLENAFDKVRQGELVPTAELIGLALAAKDHIRALIETPDAASPEDGERLLERVAALVGAASRALSPPPAAGSDPAAPALWRIRFRFAPDVLIRGTNPLLLLDELRGLGTCTVTPLTDALPFLDEMDPTACYVGWDVLLVTEGPRSAIEEVFIFVIDDMELKIEAVPQEAAKLGDILVERGDVPREAAEAAASRQERLGRLLIQDGALTEERLNAALAEQQHRRSEADGGKTAGTAGGQPAGSIRVPAERLDNLMDQVGELVIAQARLKQLIESGEIAQIKSIAEEIERLSNGLRDTTMGIRMVPIGSLFGRFRRLVRDLSQELGKDVRLSMAGEETELDKTVIERLNDPLVHIIRNSLDHGIEDAASRSHAGKARQGHIHLSATHSGAQVLITVKDDGRGLDQARIRAKAEEKGIIAPEAKLSEAELLQLIFHPGFSTAKTVTSLSGRGVGMDVVKRTIDALRGSVEVTSLPGQGTEVTLRLPLTLAIIDGLLVRVGAGRYVIPLSAVEECVELSTEDDLRHAGRNFLNIRGDLVPYLRLREMFASPLPADQYQKVVIVSTGDRRVGLVVDQVLGDHQTVIKSLSKLHSDVETFSGATILGDGTVALILDVAHLVACGQSLEQQRRAS